jgi:phosphoglycolate phosphatase-like HAD superfamily hydrolase
VPQDRFWELRRSGVPSSWLVANLGDPVRDEFERRWLVEIEKPSYLGLDNLLPGSFETLKYLANVSRLVLLTMRRNREALLQQLNHLDIAIFFNSVLSPLDQMIAETTKAELILDNLPPNGRAAMVVGDSEADIATAKQLNLTVVCVESGIRSRAFLEALKPNQIIHSIAELPALLADEEFLGLLGTRSLSKGA